MRKAFLALLVLFVAPVGTVAQVHDDNWDNLKQLQPGHKIKVVAIDLKAWEGKLVSVSDEAITIQEKRTQQEITVARSEVFRVTDLHRSKRGRNALIGLGIGVAVGSAFSADDDWDLSSTGKLIVVGWFGGMGAGVGALVPSRPTIYGAASKPRRQGATGTF